jgi:hypothetical protein
MLHLPKYGAEDFCLQIFLVLGRCFILLCKWMCNKEFDVRKSVHHHTIPINQPTRLNSFTSLLLDVYVWLNMFRAPLRPSSGAYNYTRSLWFNRWRVAVGALLVVVWQVMRILRPTSLQPPRSNGKTRGS